MKMTRKLSTLVAAAAAVGASTSVVAQQQQRDPRFTVFAAAPSWNTDVLLAAKQCTYCQLSDQDRASALGLAAISDASIETYAVRGTGPTATNRQYRTSRGIMTVRDVDGYLSFGAAGGPPATNSDTTSRIPTEAEVTRLGQDLVLLC